jgi:ADP-ribosylglycohydrolase
MGFSRARFSDRAAGAVMGAFVGDALGLGPHWFYDLEELRADFGPWISGYIDPKPGRYHAGMKAGQLSQAAGNCIGRTSNCRETERFCSIAKAL